MGEPKLQALLLLDTEPLAQEIQRSLENIGFSVRESMDTNNLISLIEKKTINLAVIEHSAAINPDSVLNSVLEISPTTQLILLSNRMEAGRALNWINSGGFACFDLPLNKNMFFRKIKPFTTVLKNQLFLMKTHHSLGKKLRSESKILAEKAQRDGLTGLASKKFFETEGESMLNEARACKQKISLIVLDIDYFKNYNDTHGHLQGDKALKKLAGILKQETRRADLSGRVGGEEFALLLPRNDEYSTHKMAERLRKTVENTYFEGQQEQPGDNLTISLGHSTFPTHADDFIRLFDLADRACYQSKKTGRNKTSRTLLEEFSLKEETKYKFNSVDLIGDFNSWEAGKDTLSRVSPNRWEKKIPIPSGKLIYGYLIDKKQVIPDKTRGKIIKGPRGNKVTEIETG
jgi:diguanylate cyclase (GGDEF)-like protein